MNKYLKEIIQDEVYTMDNPRYKLMHVLINLKAEYNIDIASLREIIERNLLELPEQRWELEDEYSYEDYEPDQHAADRAIAAMRALTEKERQELYDMLRRRG